MIFKNKKIQKLLSSFLIIGFLVPSFFLLSRPKSTLAVAFVDPVNAALTKVQTVVSTTGTVATVTSTAIKIKDAALKILNEIAKSVAKRLLASMTKSTINWINSGFHGSPLFVENPKSFFNDIAKSEIKSLIDTFGYDTVRFPFGKQFALNTIDAYRRQLEDNASYSLSLVTNDADYQRRYRASFNVGGWDGFLLNTQYPQNNPIGFTLITTNELARRIEGTSRTKADQVQDTLQKGLGFLSPQTCPSNPKYDNDIKETNRPKFKFNEPTNIPKPQYDYGGNITNQTQINSATKLYNSKKTAARDKWEDTNVCPDGLQATTPGSVVGNSIMRAMTSGQELTELQAAVGGSISAIFDTLLSKLFDVGLAKLASKSNPAPTEDNWDYFGNTLGSPNTNLNDPFSGPDQEIILKKFKGEISGKTIVTDADGIIIDEEIGNTGNGEYIPGAIERVGQELALLDNSASSSPGLLQVLTSIWQKTMELDHCLPGPDYKWEERLSNETQRNSTRLQKNMGSDEELKASTSSIAYKSLLFAVGFFKDWVEIKMMNTLPNGILFLDAISELDTMDQQSRELVEKRRNRTLALSRLIAIQSSLSFFTTQPDPGSQQEKNLITIKKQYDAIETSIPNIISIEDTRAELEIARERVPRLQTLVTQCTNERIEKKWTVPASGWTEFVGKTSFIQDPALVGKPFQIALYVQGNSQRSQSTAIYSTIPPIWGLKFTTGQEMEQFCELPIISGYSHETFTSYVRPEMNLPLVNGRNVMRGSLNLFRSSWPNFGGVNIRISCNIVYKATYLDYKGSLPNINNYVDTQILPTYDGDSILPDPITIDETTGEVIDPNLPVM